MIYTDTKGEKYIYLRDLNETLGLYRDMKGQELVGASMQYMQDVNRSLGKVFDVPTDVDCKVQGVSVVIEEEIERDEELANTPF